MFGNAEYPLGDSSRRILSKVGVYQCTDTARMGVKKAPFYY